MPDKPSDITITHQVELAISRLDSLSILPCVAVRFLQQLDEFQIAPPSLDELIESDPALTAKFFSLMYQYGLGFAEGQPAVGNALDKLSLRVVRDAFLSIKIYQPFGQDESRGVLRKQLIKNSLAVACCARNIAKIASLRIDPALAYSAGLLHNIGNLALDEVMPRSFAKIVEEAKLQNSSLCDIEQKHLGIDYTIIGKRLAQRWHLPDQISLAIWLHKSDTNVISQSMPEAKIAQIIQLAGSIAQQCGFGQWGSLDSHSSIEQNAELLVITPSQLEQIRQNIGEELAEKSEAMGLDSSDTTEAYYDIIHTTAAQLAKENTELSSGNLQLQIDSRHFDFVTDFLSSISQAVSPIDIAKNFAVRWQKFYQTGTICLYLVPAVEQEIVEAVIVETEYKTKVVSLRPPVDLPLIPEAAAESLAILNAQNHVGWLFEQLEVDFELGRTKLVPLLSNGKAIGAIVFELCYPGDLELLVEKFKMAISAVGAVLDIALTRQKQQYYAEQFARLSGRTELTQNQPAVSMSINSALIEMAAGAAHELNNPLSVISGRAQLLVQTQTDIEKKRFLEQIQENAKQISEIIDDLIGFAEPEQPKTTKTNIKQILDEAIQLTAQKTNIAQPDIQIDAADSIKDVIVDSAQIVSAIANIFSNSLESYTSLSGTVKVGVATDESVDSVKLQICDFGCGMDAETVRKAVQPFFSAKPAGRKRGMGLAYAARLIELNNGSLEIASKVGDGTVVTISLPCFSEKR